MGLKTWSWLKKDVLSHKRRVSAPPMSAVNYDPNANREEYLQAFDEFKQRGSQYNQLTIKEDSEGQSEGQSTDDAINKGTNETEGESSSHQSKSGKTIRHSLPNKMSRSLLNRSLHKKTNTPNNTSVVSENNNTIYVNEILEFEGNCINDSSFGAAGPSPPKTFYRNNSNPFPSDTKRTEKVKAESSAQKPEKKLEEARQRACGKLLSYIRPKAKTESNSSGGSGSGAYKSYDFSSTLSDEEEFTIKKSNGQDIPVDVYDEIVNIFGDFVQHNVAHDQRQIEKHNSPVKPANVSGPSDIGGISGIGALSAFSALGAAFTSFRQCEGMIDENFGFLNESKWNDYLADESECYGAEGGEVQHVNVEVTDLDISSIAGTQHGRSGFERGNNYAMSEVDSVWSRDMDSVMSQQTSKHPIYIIECKARDIKPKTSVLRNTIVTPFHFSSGSFRKTPVTLKKCCPRDSASMRLVEEAIERDYEILSTVKHPNIIMLMAACFHRKLINHMTLVLEPVDYTLNYYLHQMEKSFTILESITLVQHIASAALYLQECGYIHSNISSHNILVRERPLTVKLSSFELATEVDTSAIRAEVEMNYPQLNASKFSDCSGPSTEPEENGVSQIASKKRYMEMSKQPPALIRPPNAEFEYMTIPSKHLVYDTIYRQCLSMHNFIAPELLTIDQRFVFPTPKTDVYSLCILLWEILNKCVPFAIYSKCDMERMFAKRKLNLPFFERQRCYLFMDIFYAGLAVKSENRSIDVPQLIEMLDNIELEILTGGENPDESHTEAINNDEEDVEHVHRYVNLPQQVQVVSVDDTTFSSIHGEPEQLSGNHVNSNNEFILSPRSLDFDKSLSERERTSTKKMRKKPPRKYIKQQIRELFTAADEAPKVEAMKHTEYKEDRPIVSLNKSFRKISDGVRRNVFNDIGADEKLNENLAVIADNIRRNILDDTGEVISPRNQPNKVHSKVNEPSLEQEKKIFEHRNTPPSVVGFSVKAKKLNDSKTYGNLLDGVSTSGISKKLFNSKIDPSSSGFNGNNGEQLMPTTPIARQNYIRRQAWLSNQQPCSSSNENWTEPMVKGNEKEASPLVDDKKVNVSVRIVHNKITPKKVVRATEVAPKNVDEERPSILSKIQYFNSAKDTSKTDIPLSCDKPPFTPVRVDKIATNNNSTKYSEQTVAVASQEYESGDNDMVHSTNERKTIINELKDAMLNLQKSPLDQPQLKQSFENKLWKRELDICNRSLNSSDGGNDSKVVTSKFRSVRETILKFEKRGEVTRSPSSSHASPTELVNSLPKTNATSQQNHRKPSDSPTFIKRTIYSERILSGVDLSPVDNQMPMFDKFNFGSQKVATRVSLRQVRQTSSDVNASNRRQVVRGTSDVRHTICGSEMELLSFNASTFNSPGNGPSGVVTKYVCFNCASKMSSDELKALTYEPLNTSMNSEHMNALGEYSMRRCQALVTMQNTRSIEDLYIDDDFVHGLGANMELQSDCSDLLDIDILSSELFNSKYDAADNNTGN